MPELIVPFLATVAILTVTPGPDMLLVLRNGLRAGSHAAWLTGLGCCLGIACHATAAVLGLSAVLAASATAYLVVKAAGAGYLAYLGVRMLRAALQSGHTGTVDVIDGDDDQLRTGAAFRQGLLTNLLNPKIALLFLTLLPQFVAGDEPWLRTTATLALLFLAIAVLWWRLFTLLLRPIGRLLASRRARRVLDGVAGTALVGIGVKVVLEHR